MKTLLILIAVIGLAGAAVGQQPSEAPKPGPEHQKLGIWLGDWTYEGEVKDSPLGPGGRFSGKYMARPILDGFCVEFRTEEKGPTGTTRYFEVDGYDALNKRYTWTGFGSDGSSAVVTYTIDGTTVSFAGTVAAGGKQCQMRGTCVFAPDRTSCVDKREYSLDGKTWAPLAESRGTKVTRPAAAPEPGLTNISAENKTTPAARAGTQAEQELIKLENGWSEAMVKRDLAFLDRILANEFTETDTEGTVWTKAQELAVLTSGEFTCTSAVADDMKVCVYGDTAVVTGRNTNKSQFKGKDISGQHRWTDTWIKRDGRWQCVATQATRIVEK